MSGIAKLSPAALLLAALAVASSASAQMGGGATPFGQAGGPGGPEEEKKEGVAEAAPKAPGLLPTTPALPAPKSARKKLSVIEVDGYFRLRTDWFKNFHLGFVDDPALGGAPFARPLGCSSVTTANCDGTIGSSNMRLRLEPTINLDERTSVHLQLDLLDNLVLGSTPEGGTLTSSPGGLADGQVPPQAGVNDTRDAIRLKRVWAEVGTPLGLLKFGRMPDHWGLGIFHHGGGEDPINGGYDLDGDYGDTVDRVSFSAVIPGTDIRGAFALDWPSNQLVSNQPADLAGGQPFDLEDEDDVKQYSLIFSRMDSPTEFRDAIDRGRLVLNYGIYASYRTQSWNTDPANPAELVESSYKAYIPDAWLKVGLGKLLFEAEAAAVLGSVKDPDEAGDIDLRQFGGVARLSYRALADDLRFGLEAGFASGDQWDNTPAGRINIRNGSRLPGPGDTTASQFIFDRDYKVDLILFRELYGAVTNAFYGKPYLSYQLSKSLVLRTAAIASFAHKPVATPGNEQMLGLEFDGDLGYESGDFYAGFAYGLLFTMGGLNHPSSPPGEEGYGFLPGNLGDAGNAHTIQMRLALKF